MDRRQQIIKLTIGTLYFIGACLLIPGFRWIVPEFVERIPIGPEKFIFVPHFGQRYGNGVLILILGMGFVLLGSLADFTLVHVRIAAAMGAKGMLHLMGPICHILGSGAILYGCVVFLPVYQGLLWNGSADYNKHPPGPTTLFNMKASDFGQLLFKTSSVFYIISSLLAISAFVPAICAARRAGQRVGTLLLQLFAFCLFIGVSTLFYLNATMAPEAGVLAGWVRVAAAIGLFVAVLLLKVATLVDIRRARSSSKHDKVEIVSDLSGVQVITESDTNLLVAEGDLRQ